jgi:hypothetical protein
MRQYVCGDCGRALTSTGTGLRSWRCVDHPERWVSVAKDLSGGQEDRRQDREVGCLVKRHTRVRVRMEKET